MRKIILVQIFLILSFSSIGQLQDSIKNFIPTPELFKTTDSLAENAEAIILLDSAKSEYNENFELIFTHTTRIKILSETGSSWGNVLIPHSKDDSLMTISARSYHLNELDSVIIQHLKTEGITKNQNSAGIIENYFQIPGARKGSIIEYSYQLKIADWKQLNSWYFQNDIPVINSTYITEVPNYILFYKFLEGMRSLEDLERKSVKKMVKGKQTEVLIETYKMENIPAYIKESDIPGDDYFISKIKFQLAEYTLPGEKTEFLLPLDYEELASNWASDTYFRQVYTNSSYLQEMVDRIYHPELAKMKVIQGFYYFFRNNFTVDNTFTDNSLEEVFTARRGTAQQINMLLVKTLNQAGIDSYLIALSTIENRPTYPELPYFELFDQFVAMVRYNGSNFFMDASNKNLLFNMLQPNFINNGGLVISRIAPGFVPLGFNHQDKELITAKFEVSDTATIKGVYEVKREGYAVYSFDSRFLSSNRSYNDYLIETIFENMNWGIKKHEVIDKFDNNKYLTEYLEFNRPADSVANNYIEIKPIVFNEFEQSPLSEKSRQNPLTLYVPIVRNASYEYKIPATWKVMEMPKPRNISLEDGKGKFTYQVSMNGDKLLIEYSINNDQVIFMPEEYPMIKKFFDEISNTLNQKIILIR